MEFSTIIVLHKKRRPLLALSFLPDKKHFSPFAVMNAKSYLPEEPSRSLVLKRTFTATKEALKKSNQRDGNFISAPIKVLLPSRSF